MDLVCGIDIHKDSVMVAVTDGRAVREVPRTTDALAQLATGLVADGVARVVLEATGHYHLLVCAVMEPQGMPVMLVHPPRARAFAVARGLRAKDDPIDARMLATYGQLMPEQLWQAPTPALRHLQELVAKRRHVQQLHIAHQTWLSSGAVPVDADDRLVRDCLARRLADIDAEIEAWVTAEDELATPHRRLCSMPGIGSATASMLLARLPELGRLADREIAAMVGVAPYQQRSGTRPGHARTAGGRSDVRQRLWMPTMVACRCNPLIAAFNRRLRAAGKPGSVVMIACMHKLLTQLNAMMRKGQDWTDHTPATA